MKRAEKRVLTAIMEKPHNFSELCKRLRLPDLVVERAIETLLKAGDIHYVINGPNGRYAIRNRKDRSILKAEALESPSRSLSEDKPLPEWLKNPPQPLPRWLREPKTRRRDRK